ncbi:class I SAM-dependent methyltransferase [Flavisolibacter nicotianae]|uniref:class I SAM-dependent methyltransferase n=1 Tax=Flavisolibacter nicotianae TaxID=2364882 RepID=UPI000EB4743F|nr:class I SAM-dependent methyltransferase [Flavisolibacter nicotianae]
MKERIKNILEKEAFAPSPLGLMVNPFYFARKGLHKNIKALSETITGKILDVGCGRKPYKNLFRYSEYIGLDIENPGHPHLNEDIDIYYDGKTFPLGDGEFDNVICNQVLEHVFTPAHFLQEINRVLKKDGHLLLTVPFIWDEHEQPNDFARYSSFGLKYLLEENGFSVCRQIKSVDDVSAIFQLVNAYVYKKLMTKGKVLYYLTLFSVVFPVNVLGRVAGAILPSNGDLFLDNIILAKKN